MKKLTTEEFTEKAKEVHGDKYNYSKVKYVNAHTKVCIICSEHGEFLQTPNNHLNGQGCIKCAYPKINFSQEEFIKRAKEIHGEKYDYSKVNYNNSKIKVCITCPEHGEFWQTPEKHLNGHGCGKCVGKNKTTKDFIKESCKVHGNKYNYSKVKYTYARVKVCIICSKHGEFLQEPSKHLNGCGCPKCYASKLEDSMRKYLTENNINFEEQKTFDWLKYKSNLYLDFYLPDYNIAIECQGEQHFKPVDFAGLGKEWAEKQLLLIQSRDKIKKQLCEENDIHVLYYTNDNKEVFIV